MIKPNVKLILDSSVIFLNVSNSYSIVPYLVFFQYYRAINTGIIAILNVAYLIYRFRGKLVLKVKDPLLILFAIINILNIIFGFSTGTMGWGMIPFTFANISFYYLLLNLFNSYLVRFTFERSFWLIIRGYIWLSLASLLSIISLFVLIKFADFYPLVDLVSDKMDLFFGNVERNKSVNYFFPNSISIIQQTTAIKIPYFQEYGVITGFFHEGHTATFLTIPSIFLLMVYIKKQVLRVPVVTVFLLVMLIVSSTTNILSMTACALLYYLIEFRKNFLLVVFITLLLIIALLCIDLSFLDFIVEKLNSRSKDYSLSTIIFAFTPDRVIGTNFYNLSYWDDPNSDLNVGLISFLINIAFLLIFVYRIYKLNMSLSRHVRLVGLFVLYFFLHSMKVNMFAYSLSYMIFVVFIIDIYYKRLKLFASAGLMMR